MKRKSSRRDFLRGRAAGDAMADAVQRALPEDDNSQKPKADAGNYYLKVSRRAMACEFEVSLNAGQYESGTETALEALDMVDQLEDQLSVFRDESEICEINRTAANGPVVVEAGLFELFELSMRLYVDTEGAFDITSGPLWRVWGFARREGAVPSQHDLEGALHLVGSDKVELDPAERTIRFTMPDVQLNLGSIGKGYALDRCSDFMLEEGVCDFMIHGGRSSVIAQGSSSPTSEVPWTVGIRNPLRLEQRIAEIHLQGRALATSASRLQSFLHEGRRFGHIIDPRTGQPAEGVVSATAIAPTAAEADALSTAFYVMGAEKSLDYCAAHEGIGMVMVCPIRRKGGIEIIHNGLNADELSLFS